MNVDSILKAKGRDVETIHPDGDLRLALHRLASRGIGALVVTPDGTTVDGTISERDVVRGLNKHGAALLDLPASAVMSRHAPTCSPSDTLQHVMAEMTRSRHRHLPVLDGDGHLCGIISIGDVVKHRLEEMELEASVLRDAYIARR
jgi:CBS domain-containing protein